MKHLKCVHDYSKYDGREQRDIAHGLRPSGVYSLCEIKSIPIKQFNKLLK